MLAKNSYATASLSGSKLAFSYCPLDKAIALLKGQYAEGTVEVRIVQFENWEVGYVGKRKA